MQLRRGHRNLAGSFCRSAVCALVLAGASMGCGSGGGNPSASMEGIPAAAQAEARTILTTRCATCHGAQGRGDGMAAASMNPKPRNFHDAEWQGATADGRIETVIVQGGPAIGKSPLMPPNPDLASKPDVVRALRAMVRGFSD